MRYALLAVLVLAAAGAEATVRARATIEPAQVAAGESADLAVTVDGSQNAGTPELASTAGLQVTYVGPASEVSITNGRMTSSITHHFTVIGTKPGRYTLGPISVVVGGTRYDAGSVGLEVLAAGAATGSGSDQLTLELSVPRSEVFVRERLPLGVRLLVGNVRVTNPQYPVVTGDGVAIEKLGEPTEHREQTSRGTVQVLEFVTTATPLKPGTLTIGPATMDMALVVPSRRRSPFFGGFFRDETRAIQVQSQPLALNVLPLPTQGQPPGFGGAVGQFTFDVTATPTSVAVGDPITVKSVVQGDGSLDGLAPPALPAGDAWRVYPPQAGAPDATTQGRTFEQVVIPLQAGRLTLPRLRFSYFDPIARGYRTLDPEPITIDVRPSPHAEAAPQIVGAPASGVAVPERPETLARDIVFIKDAPGTLRPIGFRRYHSPWWWALQLVPVILWAAASWYGGHRRRLAGDVRYARFTRAGREARATLARARDALRRGDVAAGHDAVAAAVRDYLAAKLDLPPGTVAETAPARLRAAGLDGADVEAFFGACETGRFAPDGASRVELERAIERAEAIVGTLERARRLAPAAALAALVGLVTLAVAADEGPTALFFRGNGLYSNGQYAEAAASYEKALAGGLESGPLQFNLGNAWLRAGDVGRAILAYERAGRLIPGDPDLAANLRFAREQAADVVEEPTLARLVVPVAARASTDSLLGITAAAWWAAWLLLAVAAIAPGAARIGRRAAAVAGIAAAVTAASAGYRWWTLERPTTAVVIAHEDATVRSAPAAGATALFVTKPGSTFQVDRTREGWSQVTSRDGRRGWVDSAALATL